MKGIGDLFNLTDSQLLNLSTFLDIEHLKYMNDPDRIARIVKDILGIKDRNIREATLLAYSMGLKVNHP